MFNSTTEKAFDWGWCAEEFSANPPKRYLKKRSGGERMNASGEPDIDRRGSGCWPRHQNLHKELSSYEYRFLHKRGRYLLVQDKARLR